MGAIIQRPRKWNRAVITESQARPARSGATAMAQRLGTEGWSRGELGPNFDVSELAAAIAGPLFHRRWFSRQKLDDAFVHGVVERALGWSQ